MRKRKNQILAGWIVLCAVRVISAATLPPGTNKPTTQTSTSTAGVRYVAANVTEAIELYNELVTVPIVDGHAAGEYYRLGDFHSQLLLANQ